MNARWIALSQSVDCHRVLVVGAYTGDAEPGALTLSATPVSAAATKEGELKDRICGRSPGRARGWPARRNTSNVAGAVADASLGGRSPPRLKIIIYETKAIPICGSVANRLITEERRRAGVRPDEWQSMARCDASENEVPMIPWPRRERTSKTRKWLRKRGSGS